MTFSSTFTVDLISDLNLSANDIFDWTGKATSLFCVVAGNISSDLSVITRTLEHLGDCYRGVFFIDGALEHQYLSDHDSRIDELKRICSRIDPVIYLHNHVVILNNIAFVACNGWYGNTEEPKTVGDYAVLENYRIEDIAYLNQSIKSLQSYDEVDQIVIISNSLPTEYLCYGDLKVKLPEKMGPGICLKSDRKHKVTHWLYGSSTVTVDTVINDRTYCNNPAIDKNPYWPKRVIIR